MTVTIKLVENRLVVDGELEGMTFTVEVDNLDKVDDAVKKLMEVFNQTVKPMIELS